MQFVPMFHIFGLNGLGAMTHVMGCKLVIMERFDFEEYLRLIQKYKVSIMMVKY